MAQLQAMDFEKLRAEGGESSEDSDDDDHSEKGLDTKKPENIDVDIPIKTINEEDSDDLQEEDLTQYLNILSNRYSAI